MMSVLDNAVNKELAAGLCYKALIQEPCIWPQFGLVGPESSGSHKDMDYTLLVKSAQALVSFIRQSFELGTSTILNREEMFSQLRYCGINAEAEMMCATGGINTHKGSIFLLLLMNYALSHTLTIHTEQAGKDSARPRWSHFLDTAWRISRDDILREIKNPYKGYSQTYGQWVLAKYGISGIRGVVAGNFQLLRRAFSWYINNPKVPRPLALGYLRLFFLAYSDDTNVIKRANFYNASLLKRSAQKVLSRGGLFTRQGLKDVQMLEQEMIDRQWSAAAAGDLLIALIFLVNLYEHNVISCQGYS